MLILIMACAPAPAPAGGAPPPALVEVAPASKGHLMETWSTLGEVRPSGAAELAAGAAGSVVEVLVREGDRVRRGAVLLRIDERLARAQLRAAEASLAETRVELEQARRDLERQQKVQAGVLSASELDAATSRVAALDARAASLEANVALAAAQLDRHLLRAPFDGVLTTRSVDPGDWVNPGQALLSVVSQEGAEIDVAVSAERAAHLATGAPVALGTLPAGEILAVVPALDPATRTALVRVRPPEEAKLLPGQSITVTFSLDWGDEGLLVPLDALILAPGSARVTKVQDGTAASIPVELLASGDASALVRGEGLAEGDVLVVRGNERVRPGQAVVVKE